MLNNSGKRCSKYGTFYGPSVLLVLVRSTPLGGRARRKPPISYRLSFGTLWTNVIYNWEKMVGKNENEVEISSDE
jgi:hypothetical protein